MYWLCEALLDIFQMIINITKFTVNTMFDLIKSRLKASLEVFYLLLYTSQWVNQPVNHLLIQHMLACVESANHTNINISAANINFFKSIYELKKKGHAGLKATLKSVTVY